MTRYVVSEFVEEHVHKHTQCSFLKKTIMSFTIHTNYLLEILYS
jgi:hypothetical protein